MYKLFQPPSLPLIILTLTSLWGDSGIKQFTLGIWPEYDNTGILVYVQVEISPEDLPMNFNLLVPESSNSAVMAVENMGNAEFAPVELINDGVKTYMPIFSDNIRYYGQFYYHPFSPGSTQRKFNYNLEFSSDLFNYTIIIQEHLGAENFTTNLPDPITEWDEYQLTYQKQIFPELTGGNSHFILIQYDNPSNMNSVAILNEIILKHSEIENLEENALDNEIYTLYEKLHQNIFLLVTMMVIILISITRFIKPAINSVKQFCKGCGKIINSQSQYCHHCGGAV